MTSVRSMPAFDEPQWKWFEEDDNHSTAGIDNTVVFYDGLKATHETRLYVPMEFYHFFRSLHGMEGRCTGFTVQKVRNRFYFNYTHTGPFEGGSVTLWYWTPSNLPSWAKRFTR